MRALQDDGLLCEGSEGFARRWLGLSGTLAGE